MRKLLLLLLLICAFTIPLVFGAGENEYLFDGETISKNLRFYGLNNLKIFEKRINFVHPNKRKILTELINNYKRLKLHSEDRDRIFIKTLKRQDFLTAKEISAKVNMHHRSTLNYLNKLKDRKMIARTYDTWPNKWHLTKN